jgi:hypothetical protein
LIVGLGIRLLNEESLSVQRRFSAESLYYWPREAYSIKHVQVPEKQN